MKVFRISPDFRILDLLCQYKVWANLAFQDLKTGVSGFLNFRIFTHALYFFYQGTVSAIKFRKRPTYLKTTIVMPKKFGSKGLITAIKVTKI